LESQSPFTPQPSRLPFLIIVGGFGLGIVVFFAHLVALADGWHWFGSDIVSKRLFFHVGLQVRRVLPVLALLGPAIVLAMAVAVKQLGRELTPLRVLAGGFIGALAYFHAAYFLRGEWETVPGAIGGWPWIWVGAMVAAMIVTCLTSRATETPSPLIRPLFMELIARPGWLGLAGLVLVTSTWSMAYYNPSVYVIVFAGGIMACFLAAMLFSTVVLSRRGRRRPAISLAVGSFVFATAALAVLSLSLVAGVFGTAYYWGRIGITTRMAQDFGGLAELPPSARALDGIVTGSVFTLPVYLRFKANPIEIRQWLEDSPGVKRYEKEPFGDTIPGSAADGPLWTPAEMGREPSVYEADGKGNGGTVIVNEETGAVFIYVCWS
jgi:hypothetical protein